MGGHRLHWRGECSFNIDTGIDSDHVGLDDLDDDNSTNDSKVIAFYDAVNNPDKTNGTEIKAYDDQGHGTHCAGNLRQEPVHQISLTWGWLHRLNW
ncbi:MAG: hypothetical protein Ct9H90mP24_5810 [Methanobacteriota archaeon]|nr:MAG: hypothetical protein Ct9H90mP24_5810 [Euryarchaeota archaeon]